MAWLSSSRQPVHRCLRIPSLREGDDFPPQDLVPPRRARDLPFPKITTQEALPLRTERHIPNSITTLRRRLSVALISQTDQRRRNGWHELAGHIARCSSSWPLPALKASHALSGSKKTLIGLAANPREDGDDRYRDGDLRYE